MIDTEKVDLVHEPQIVLDTGFNDAQRNLVITADKVIGGLMAVQPAAGFPPRRIHKEIGIENFKRLYLAQQSCLQAGDSFTRDVGIFRSGNHDDAAGLLLQKPAAGLQAAVQVIDIDAATVRRLQFAIDQHHGNVENFQPLHIGGMIVNVVGNHGKNNGVDVISDQLIDNTVFRFLRFAGVKNQRVITHLLRFQRH